MKKLGILGGMGPESTLLYYKEIDTKFKENEATGSSGALHIYTGGGEVVISGCEFD